MSVMREMTVVGRWYLWYTLLDTIKNLQYTVLGLFKQKWHNLAHSNMNMNPDSDFLDFHSVRRGAEMITKGSPGGGRPDLFIKYKRKP